MLSVLNARYATNFLVSVARYNNVFTLHVFNVIFLPLSRPIHIDMAVKTQLYLCNIQGVSVRTVTPCILHRYSCVFECHIYMTWST